MQSCVLMVAGRLTADNSAALVAYREVAAKSGPDMSAALKVWTWDTEGIVSARDRDEEPNEALYIPYVINARIYVVSLGQQSVGWRRFADWRVQFNTVEDGKIVPRADFPVGMLKGDLDKVSIAPLVDS